MSERSHHARERGEGAGAVETDAVPVEETLRLQAPHVLGALVRALGRFDLAEDAVQEALLAGYRSWTVDGVPEDPRSWLIRVGHRRMVDLLRSERARARREREVAVADPALRGPGASVSEVDDGLALLFLCCHPSLSTTSQVALTLRAVGGLTTAQIAHAHGVDEATMGTRISRAKRRLAEAGARFTPPVEAGDRAARTVAVMRVLYLVFNEGYTASAGEELSRVDLMAEAIRLARMLRAALPEEAEVAGLLAMMLLLWSRRAARTGADGVLVPLEEQDRSLWDVEAIEEGRALLDGVWNRGEAGRYQVEAAIAAVHASSEVSDRAGPVRIAVLYLWLERLVPTAPVRLARVVAVARAYGAERGLALLDELDRRHRWGDDPLVRRRERVVRAHLSEMVGDTDTAEALYREAAALGANRVEGRYLSERADRLR
ncbi:RNA polymerase sigma factor [Nocardiopsis alba]|uniref:RNA polymerase sigma factor n=1 Tax=Nocardiopsis alba TaxID=53437 RepID=UPI0033B0D3CC